MIQSTHKTLSALTQAAMLHVQGTRMDAARISQALQLLQVINMFQLCDCFESFCMWLLRTAPTGLCHITAH